MAVNRKPQSEWQWPKSVTDARREQVAGLVGPASGILLDISFGGSPQDKAVWLAPQNRQGKPAPRTQIVHDPRELPFPLPDGIVHTAVVTHVLEFIPGARFFGWWNELHRVMQKKGVVYLSGPYGGDESQGWLSDPTHVTRVIEETFFWLDPSTPMYGWHGNCGRPTPMPWKVLTQARVPATHGTFSYNVQMQRLSPDWKTAADEGRVNVKVE